MNTESNEVLKIPFPLGRGRRVHLQVKEKCHEWKRSVANHPVFLKHKLTLQHIYTLVGIR